MRAPALRLSLTLLLLLVVSCDEDPTDDELGEGTSEEVAADAEAALEADGDRAGKPDRDHWPEAERHAEGDPEPADATEPGDPEVDELRRLEREPSPEPEAPATGHYGVVLEAALSIAGAPLALDRLDAVRGDNGRVYFSGTAGDIWSCSFDAEAMRSEDLDLRCEHFDPGSVFFIPRVAVSRETEPAVTVVWDLLDDRHTQARFSPAFGEPYEQSMFIGFNPSVNHAGVAFFNNEFWVVSEFASAIGRGMFSRLPDGANQGGDWVVCNGATQCPDGFHTSYGPDPHHGPAIAANLGAGVERVAWVSYYSRFVFLHTCQKRNARVTCTTDLFDPADFDPERDLIKYESTEGVPGWPDVAVDQNLDIHLAWHNSVEVAPDEWDIRGLDYVHLRHGDLASTPLHMPTPDALGDVSSYAPSLGVNAAGDVLVAFSAVRAPQTLYTLHRDHGADDWIAPPQVQASGKTGGPYHPAVVGSGSTFWLLYNGDGEHVHALKVARSP